MAASVAVPALGVVTAGVGYNVIRKLLFQLDGTGLHGIQHPFVKPIWTAGLSALACTSCFLVYLIELWIHRRKLRHPAQTPLVQDEQADALLTISDYEQEQQQQQQQQSSGAGDGGAECKQETPFHECMSREAYYSKGSYGPGRYTKGHLLRLSAPGIAGIVSITLQGIGLKYISASVSLVISSSVVIFTALLAITILKRRLMWLHWLGIALAVLGIMLTALADPVTRALDRQHRLHASGFPADEWVHGLACTAASSGQWHASAASDCAPGGRVAVAGGPADWAAAGRVLEPTGRDVLLGILLTAVAQLVFAVRMVLEEQLLEGMFKLHQLELLGVEGGIGLVFMAAIALPIAHLAPGQDVDGRYENAADTFVMLHRNRHLSTLNALLLLCSLVANWTGCLVTARLGSVFRSVLLTLRTGIVWAINLAIYYAGIGHGLLGERWASGSPLELVGFLMSLAGVVLYALVRRWFRFNLSTMLHALATFFWPHS
ncbi:hypothetical protein WJX72_001816 [[Myrmecia] bisecta]|uniref:EamA domain-containing protein n=1 Tax=[Myrmecia] bisecta TaxID=41462 RepID=A0AAW1PJC2_9CHLO